MGFSLRLFLGLIVPLALVLAAVLLVPTGAGVWLGISVRSWLLFACAPLTSVVLALCLGRAAQ